ncbi:MAG: thiamine pyrophosphate-dependent dehydrogenase E1 component subunit alpha, partial [Bacteroidetes bacterium]|nr:thiamine pyrophosphate-dependent dehydrogenase E1 component subunit alpha [Bacteroidota bacterium]
MSKNLSKDTYKKAYSLMCTARALSDLYEENKEVTSKYVHATSKGHEAIQLAVGLQLTKNDWAAPYYRDDAMLLAIGLTPYELMLQLLCKKDDPFSGGRTYYSHPSLKREGFPKIPHQSSATGMQAIPTTGVAMGIQYQEKEKITNPNKGEEPIVVCSLGDAAITEGEVAEAFQMAVLKKLPILYLVQDNEWDISAHASETRAVDATHYAKGFGLKTYTIDGTDFAASYTCIKEAFEEIREQRTPILVHAKVPLLNHHTSGVRMEWYRDDLEEAKSRDPLPKLKAELLKNGFAQTEILEVEQKTKKI